MSDSRAIKSVIRSLLGVMLGPIILVLAASSPSLGTTDMPRQVVSGGAMHEGGGSYILSATVGEVGVVGFVEGSGHALGSGFWQGHAEAVGPVAAPVASQISFVNGLRQNFPNPFTGETSIVFTVAARSPVQLTVYDVTGRRVASLANAELEAGRYVLPWKGRDDGGSFVASGVYFYRLNVGSWTETRRMLRLR